MRLVALIILVMVSPKTGVTTSSYEGFKLARTKKKREMIDADDQKMEDLPIQVALAEEKILAVVGDAHPDSHLVHGRREVPMTRDKAAVIRAFSSS